MPICTWCDLIKPKQPECLGPLRVNKWTLHITVCMTLCDGFKTKAAMNRWKVENKRVLFWKIIFEALKTEMLSMFHFALIFRLSSLSVSSPSFGGQLLACGSVKLDRWSGTAGHHWYSSTELQAVQSSIRSWSENKGAIVPSLKVVLVTASLLYLFCYEAAVIKVKYVFCVGSVALCTPFRLSLHRSSSRLRAARPGSAVWNTYSVTFFSRCAEVEIWALWTCLLVENGFLRRPVKLLLLETWLTIRECASVLVSVRNQLRYVSPVGCRIVYVYVWVCGSVWVCVRKI